MKLKFNARGWHSWTSVVLALPLFIVAITGLFMAHEGSLGHIRLGFSSRPEAKTVFRIADGTILVAGKEATYRVQRGHSERIPSLAGEIRLFQYLSDGALLAAGKYGLWRARRDGSWRQLYRADVHGFQETPDGDWHMVTKDCGLLFSSDQGTSWQREADTGEIISALPATPMHMGRVMHDLHTGKLLFGKQQEWIWIDVLGLVLVMLVLTGVHMWQQARRR